MNARQDEVYDVGLHHDVLRIGVETHRQRAEHNEKEQAADQQNRVIGKDRTRIRCERRIDHLAQQDRRRHFGNTADHRHKAGKDQNWPTSRERPAKERQQRLRRRAIGFGEGIDLEQTHSAASVSVAINPPDWRAQNPAYSPPCAKSASWLPCSTIRP